MKMKLHKLQTSIVVGITVCLISSCKPWGNIYQKTPVTGQITVTEEWKEIVFDKPYKPLKDQQSLCLEFAEPVVEVAKEWHPRLKDGRKVIFEIDVTDSTGNSFIFNEIVSLNTEQTCLVANENDTSKTVLQQDRTFVKLNIKSNTPIMLSRVYWYSYNIRDLK